MTKRRPYIGPSEAQANAEALDRRERTYTAASERAPHIVWRFASIQEAIDWLWSVWEWRDAPMSLHRRMLVEDGDLLGGPQMTEGLLAFISARSGDRAKKQLSQDCWHGGLPADVCRRCDGMGKVVITDIVWRYPVWRALDQLHRGDHAKWGPIARRWWHPTPAEVVVAVAANGFRWPTPLYYATGDRIPEDFAEVFALSAIGKFRSRFHHAFTTRAAWTEKSESQQVAESSLDAATSSC